MPNPDKWKELATQASVEPDSRKLLKLVEALNALLVEKEEAFRKLMKPSPGWFRFKDKLGPPPGESGEQPPEK